MYIQEKFEGKDLEKFNQQGKDMQKKKINWYRSIVKATGEAFTIFFTYITFYYFLKPELDLTKFEALIIAIFIFAFIGEVVYEEDE